MDLQHDTSSQHDNFKFPTHCGSSGRGGGFGGRGGGGQAGGGCGGGKGYHSGKGLHHGKGHHHHGKGHNMDHQQDNTSQHDNFKGPDHCGSGGRGGRGGGGHIACGRGGGKGYHHSGKGLHHGKGHHHHGKGHHGGWNRKRGHGAESEMVRLNMRILQLNRRRILLKLDDADDEAKQSQLIKRLQRLNAKESSFIQDVCARRNRRRHGKQQHDNWSPRRGPRNVSGPLLDDGLFLDSIPEHSELVIIDQRSLGILHASNETDETIAKALEGIKHVVSVTPGKIMRQTNKNGNAANLVLVTDKRRLQRRTLQFGAQVMTMRNFLRVLKIEPMQGPSPLESRDSDSDDSELNESGDEDENDNLADGFGTLGCDALKDVEMDEE